MTGINKDTLVPTNHRIGTIFSFFAVLRADGKARVPNITRFCTTLLNKANDPYASGPYKRVRIGVVTMASAAINSFPDKTIEVSLKKSFSPLNSVAM